MTSASRWTVWLLVAAAIVTLIASFGRGWGDGRSSNQVPTGRVPATIEIRSTGFVPAALTVPVNTSVCWKNGDTKAHRPYSDAAPPFSLDPGKDLKSRETWCFPFVQAGTWNYVDKLHGELKGKITVQ